MVRTLMVRKLLKTELAVAAQRGYSLNKDGHVDGMVAPVVLVLDSERQVTCYAFCPSALYRIPFNQVLNILPRLQHVSEQLHSLCES